MVLYQLRHGGASGDYLEGRRQLPDIALRGRWFSMTSVRRYTKAAQVQKFLNQVPEHVRVFTRWAHQHLDSALDNQFPKCPKVP